MATAALSLPSTIVVMTEDPVNLPLKWCAVVVKQLFPWGLKEIKTKKDKIFINLSYTPAAKTLRQKFGTLPIRYMRVRIEDEEEFRILENVVRRYRFNLVSEDVPPSEAMPIKKILPSPYYPAAIVHVGSDDDDDDDDDEGDVNEPPQKKMKVPRGPSASTSSSSSSSSLPSAIASTSSYWPPPLPAPPQSPEQQQPQSPRKARKQRQPQQQPRPPSPAAVAAVELEGCLADEEGQVW